MRLLNANAIWKINKTNAGAAAIHNKKTGGDLYPPRCSVLELVIDLTEFFRGLVHNLGVGMGGCRPFVLSSGSSAGTPIV